MSLLPSGTAGVPQLHPNDIGITPEEPLTILGPLVEHTFEASCAVLEEHGNKASSGDIVRENISGVQFPGHYLSHVSPEVHYHLGWRHSLSSGSGRNKDILERIQSLGPVRPRKL